MFLISPKNLCRHAPFRELAKNVNRTGCRRRGLWTAFAVLAMVCGMEQALADPFLSLVPGSSEGAITVKVNGVTNVAIEVAGYFGR